MSPLAKCTMILAGVELVLGLPLTLFPRKTAALWKRFPRNVWAGRIISAGVLFWAAAQLKVMPIEFLAPYSHLILPLTPVVIFLSWIWMDELLACRALGGLLVLIPAPLLSCIRTHDSPWRLVLSVLAYLMIIDGMLLLTCPYLLRDAIDFIAERPGRSRGLGVFYTVCAVALAWLALSVY